jgi:acyl-CoA oxidase
MHGSNVRGLLTEAHYDPATKEFVINSGSEYGMKFWIGAAANLANMCVVWAQLWLGDKCHGVHAFVVPIRDKASHRPCHGVTIGDCGPKMGVDSIDNGFIIFKNVRVPRTHLLNKLSDVTEAGEFVTSIKNDDKRFGLQLGALSGGRVIISLNGSIMA